jgi:GNAT superfamily N-acetyltransferase
MYFRPISPADRQALFAISSAVRNNIFGANASVEGEPDAPAADWFKPDHHGWLCEVLGRPVGFCIGDGTTGEICSLGVMPEFEGRGIGSALLLRTEAWLWSQKSLRHDSPADVNLGLWVRTSANRSLRAYHLYRRRGWVEVEAKSGRLMLAKRKPCASGVAEVTAKLLLTAIE